MGKGKTDTAQICPNEQQQNDVKKSNKDKENSIKTNKSKSEAKIKARKDLSKEVLEDENTNDSNTSTNTKSSQSSSRTSSSTSNSTNEEKHNSKDLKSKTKDSTKTKDTANSKTDNSTENEETKTKFRIASNNSTEFKLRIVPLEKLLERPPTNAPIITSAPTAAPAANRSSKDKTGTNLPFKENNRRLPKRKTKPVSFIELSDSEEEQEDTDIIIQSSSDSEKKTKTKQLKEASSKRSTKESATSDSEEEEPKKTNSKNNKSKKTNSSDSEKEDENLSRTRNTTRTATKVSSASEEEPLVKKKSQNKKSRKLSEDTRKRSGKNTNRKDLSFVPEEGESEEEFPNTSDSKNKSSKKAADSEEESQKKSTSAKRAASKSSRGRKKSLELVSESEDDDNSNKVTDKSNSKEKESSKTTSESIEDKNSTDSEQTKVSKSNSVSEDDDDEAPKKAVNNSKRKRIEKSTESEHSDSVRARPKRKAVEKSADSDKGNSDSEEDKPIQSVYKKKTKRKPSASDNENKGVKRKQLPKKSKSSKISGPPPSPSTVRRCAVRVKRSKLSDFKDIGKNKSKRKMNGGTRSEKPTTSRRRHITSDDDSDVSYKRNSNIDKRLADHDYDGLDNLDEDNDEDNENESQKSSDSEIIPTRKRRVFRKDKEEEAHNSDSDFETKKKDKKKKRRIRRNSSGDSDDDEDDEDKKKIKRKDIRKIIKSDDLKLTTKEAAKEEEERRRRIEERQKIYNQIYEKRESAEVTELVLDFDADTKKALLEVDKGLVKKLKPHQVTGVKFMWDACFETVKDAQEKPGSGCILAHCMGLGKTMQICTLSHTLLANSQKTNVERVLIISPLSTLNNWAREFKQWIGFTKKRNIEIYDMSKYKDKPTRIFKLSEWFEEGGVCILGYDMYRILSNEKAKGLRKKQREQLMQSLVDPGPDMVVCDEGHLLKNEKTSISKAVTRMRTRRRIVLTGTPLQNNLKEYYCMIQFIKPNLLGTYKEYLNRFVNPISNGQYTDSTDRDIRLMKHRSHILHKLLEGCIQRRDYSVLAPYLPPKHEYVVYTTLSDLQQLLYEHYMVYQRDLSVIAEGKGAKLFQDFQELRRIWTHPMNMRINSDSVIRKKVLADENDSIDDFICDDDNDDDDAASTSDTSDDNSSKSFASRDGGKSGFSGKAAKGRSNRRNAKADEHDSDIEEVPAAPQDDPSEWWKRFVADKELNNINHSPKLVILMRLLEQCEAIGDKLLVFSQSLQSLDTIEHFLSLIDSKTRGYEYEGDVGDFQGFWSPGTDYFRLDGSCSVEHRESMCKKFNDTSNLRARLFLISTRAGGLGINLVSANRVVIFDVSWNPSHDTQSIFRVYRFGQDKPCYIYRLIAMGTMEQKLYERQVAKQATAKRVIDEQQISRHYNQSDLQELYTYELKPSTPREIPILPKDRLFAELLTVHETLLFKYHEHDSLLENEESENLSPEERKAAWSEYEAEKTRTVQAAQYMSYDRSAYGQYGNSSGSVTSNKIFGFRSDVLLQLLNLKIAKDHPEMTPNQVIQVVPTYLNLLYSQMNSGDPTMYKDLLTLHATLVHPSGMYMNPLLYVNQNPSAAGYYQAGAQTANGMAAVPGVVGGPMAPPSMVAPMAPPAPVAAPAPPAGGAGFDPNEVYEID